MSQPSVATYFSTRKRTYTDDYKLHKPNKIAKREVKAPVQSNFRHALADPNTAEYPLRKNTTNVKRTLNNEPAKTRSTITNYMCKINVHKASKEVSKSIDNTTEIRNKILASSRLSNLKAALDAFNDRKSKLNAAELRTNLLKSSPTLKPFKSVELEVELSPQKTVPSEKQYLSPKKDLTAKKNLLNLLSPTKNATNLIIESPTKKYLDQLPKHGLTLPYKYRYLAEIFRTIDIITQILYNRKETITFKKLKTGVEEMLKRSLTLKHIAQIRHLYPDAFDMKYQKIRPLGIHPQTNYSWELVLEPKLSTRDQQQIQANTEVDSEPRLTLDILLNRRRHLYDTLIELVKQYHNEFLLNLDPPMHLQLNEVVRWHPDFALERVPDIAEATLPPNPNGESTVVSGETVMQKASELFQCNTRMEAALRRLRDSKVAKGLSELNDTGHSSGDTNVEGFITHRSRVLPNETISKPSLRGIPAALLERVRERQAAKTLAALTRPPDKEHQVRLYGRLGALARLLRHLFVSEKKSVLPMEVVTEKLSNCCGYRSLMSDALSCRRTATNNTTARSSTTVIDEHLNVLCNECPEWITIYVIRNIKYIKVQRDMDISIIVSKLDTLAKKKNCELDHYVDSPSST